MVDPASANSKKSPLLEDLPRRVGFGALWLGFTIYAFGFAPADDPAQTFALIKRLSSMDVDGINPLIVYLFNIMGVLPMMYSAVLYADGRSQGKLKAWPFVAGSFFLGAFALLPYFVLRRSPAAFTGKKDWYLKIWDSRITAIVIAGLAVTLLTLGLVQGDWSDFIQQWQQNRFIHVMSLDFCMLSLLFPFMLKDDMQRRGMDNKFLLAFAAVPLLGSLAYLVVRPPLIETEVAA